MKLKHKTLLIAILYHNDYDIIHIHEDGRWNKATTGTVFYKGISFNRASYYNLNKRQCKDLVKAIEDSLLMNNNFRTFQYHKV